MTETTLDIDLCTTVLVVDDDEDLADTYTVWLEHDGFDVVTRTRGDEALE